MERKVRQADQDTWDKIWKDRYGHVVLWQRPNIPLIGWLVLTIASIATTHTLSNVFWYAALASLAVFAVLEIFKGVNYFRRALGVIVVLVIVAALFKVGY